MDWDDEYTLLATSSKGGALDFLNLDAPAPTEAEMLLPELVRHWMNERHVRTILAAQEQLLGLLLDHIRRQTDTVQAPFVAIPLPQTQTRLMTAEKAYATSTTYVSASPLLGTAAEFATSSGSSRRPAHFVPPMEPNKCPAVFTYALKDVHLSVYQTGRPSLWKKISSRPSHSTS
ncbi:hypothetical protein ARMGADRAFT_1075426 [Armillaria gallica]|uniref:Uncharacterized protein n=1 Tax=Armillaria gallica TaxID=47427 RepID=A0A2H3EGX5_ARMGA|nr:hypothetical protein ARMGADRAFT_1075426 [Armillaria gallica]